MAEGDEIVMFPAFLTPSDPLWTYSDGAFHAACFALDPNGSVVQRAYEDWRKIWDSRPRNLTKDEERVAWAKSAFANFRKEFQ